MTWHVNFVRSKDAQKQLARTSLSSQVDQVMLSSMILVVFSFSYNLALLKNNISMSDSIFETVALGCNEHGLWDSFDFSAS